MKALLTIPAIVLSFLFELTGRVLYQISEIFMGAAIMILSAVSGKRSS